MTTNNKETPSPEDFAEEISYLFTEEFGIALHEYTDFKDDIVQALQTFFEQQFSDSEYEELYHIWKACDKPLTPQGFDEQVMPVVEEAILHVFKQEILPVLEEDVRDTFLSGRVPCEYESDVDVVNFTLPQLETPLKMHRVTSTIRGREYMDEKDIREGQLLIMQYKKKRLGLARVTGIERVTWDDLDRMDLVQAEGFQSPGVLKRAIKQLWRFHIKRLKSGKLTLPVIHFQWIG